MKSFLVFIALFGVLTLSSSLSAPVTSAANAGRKEQAIMKFNAPVALIGVTLKGEYLFVHDDDAMLRGEACTYVYKGIYAVPDRLVASFHCRPAMRAKVANFTVRTFLTSPGKYEVKEYQFPGTEAHLVPINPHAGHVNIAN